MYNHILLLNIIFTTSTLLCVFLLTEKYLIAVRSFAEEAELHTFAFRKKTDKVFHILRTIAQRPKRESGFPKGFLPFPFRKYRSTINSGNMDHLFRDSTASQSPVNAMCMGPPGVAGHNGWDGEDGKPGADGFSGLDQADLLASITEECFLCPAGSPGSIGPEGPRGPPGAIGLSGPPGIDGQNGQIGEVGLFAGSPGPRGRRGAKGSRGQPGQDILYGRGLPGPRGAAGMKGKTGNIGEPGKGFKGPPGPPGGKGLPGSVGADGLEGEDGEQGDPGADLEYCPCPQRSAMDEILVPAAEQTDPDDIVTWLDVKLKRRPED